MYKKTNLHLLCLLKCHSNVTSCSLSSSSSRSSSLRPFDSKAESSSSSRPPAVVVPLDGPGNPAKPSSPAEQTTAGVSTGGRSSSLTAAAAVVAVSGDRMRIFRSGRTSDCQPLADFDFLAGVADSLERLDTRRRLTRPRHTGSGSPTECQKPLDFG